ncbi:MAG: hypothetical protein ACTSU5_03825 [Promethearchaeota archaeon]
MTGAAHTSLKNFRNGELLGWARKLQLKCDALAGNPVFTPDWIRGDLLPFVGCREVRLDFLEEGDLAFSKEPFPFLELLFIFRPDDEIGNSLVVLVSAASESEEIAGEDLVALVDFYLDTFLHCVGGGVPELARTAEDIFPLGEYYSLTEGTHTTANQIAGRREGQLKSVPATRVEENVARCGGKFSTPGGTGTWCATFTPIPGVDLVIARVAGRNLEFSISRNALSFPPKIFKYVTMVYTNAVLYWAR